MVTITATPNNSEKRNDLKHLVMMITMMMVVMLVTMMMVVMLVTMMMVVMGLMPL